MAWFKAVVTQEMALRLHETEIAVSAESINAAYEKVKAYTDQDGLSTHIDCVLITSARTCPMSAFDKIDLLLS